MKNIRRNIVLMGLFLAVTPLCGMHLGEHSLLELRRNAFDEVPTEEVKQRAGLYKNVVKDVPEKYWNVILGAKKKNEPVDEEMLTKLNRSSEGSAINMYRWKKIASQYNLYSSLGQKIPIEPMFDSKTIEDPSARIASPIYYFLKDDSVLCTGKITNEGLSEEEDRKLSYERYQINLMPKGPMVEDFDQLLSLLASNNDLRKNICSFALLSSFNDEILKMSVGTGMISSSLILPKIIIYCAVGKDKAQAVLNTICEAFKNKGLDITPRYSKKVTSYIYYQQGLEEDREVPELFEPNLVHYHSRITETNQDYYLKDPVEEKVEEKKESWWPMSFIRDKYNALRENINIYNAGLLLGVAGTVGIAAGYYVYKTWLKK